MKVLGNILWLVFGGIELAIGYVIAGLLLCIFIITIPLGVQAMELGAFTLWPFGRALVPTGKRRVTSGIGNVLWFVLCGIWMAIGHVIAALFLAVTIVGLPLAAAHVKLAKAALAPFGKEIVPLSMVRDRPDAIVTPALG